MWSRQIGCSGKSLSPYASTKRTLIVNMAVFVCVCVCVCVCVLTEVYGYNRSQAQDSESEEQPSQQPERYSLFVLLLYPLPFSLEQPFIMC